ncbi:MAG: hypothetical protein PHP64_03475 [Actinomycetota bacterium]|nr:hypothetical protein [Actinomycetota bacterium]
MTFMKSVGRLGGKLGSNKDFVSGIIEGMDPKAVAGAINENADFLGEVMKHLDPKAIAEAMSEGLSFAGELLGYMEPEAVAEVMNKNEMILPRYIERISPNVFTRSAGSVLAKLRYATYKPPIFQKSNESEIE